MSDLPKITNIPVEIEINGIKIQAKKAGIYDLALMQDFLAKMEELNPESRNLKALAYGLFICMKKIYPDISEEYVNDLLPACLVMEKPELDFEIMTKLGFFPQSQLPKEEKEKGMK